MILLIQLKYVFTCRLSFFECVCVSVDVFTCMGSHMCTQVAGLTETLPALVAEILSLPHQRRHHP